MRRVDHLGKLLLGLWGKFPIQCDICLRLHGLMRNMRLSTVNRLYMRVAELPIQ